MGLAGESFAAAPDAGCYPDLVECGTLSRALQRVADERGLDLRDIRPDSNRGSDVYRTARMESGHGRVSIGTALNERFFLVSLVSTKGGWGWPEGKTDSLGEAAEVAAAWLGGIRLAEVAERFPFMSFSRMALGFESGTPVDTAWEIILTDYLPEDDYALYRDMVTALHAHPRVRALFPVFSHYTFRLSLDPYHPNAGGIRVDLTDDGLYSVRCTIAGPRDGTLLTGIDLVNLADAVASLL